MGLLDLFLSLALVCQDGGTAPTFLGREVARTMHWRGAEWLLRETRENEEDGERLRRWLDVRSPEVVCDFGCGNGYHTLPLARAVAPAGRVLAVDLQPEMLALLRERAEAAGVTGIEPILAEPDDPHLPRAAVDVALLVDVYHELDDPGTVMGALRDALAPDGRAVLVEFRAEDPAVPILRLHKMTRAQVVNELAVLGFRWVDACEDLPWQHALAFAPEPAVVPLSDAARDVHAAREVARDAWRCRASSRDLSGYLAEEVERLGGDTVARDEALAELCGGAFEPRSEPADHLAPDARGALWHVDAGDGRRATLRLAPDPGVRGRWRVDGFVCAPGLVAMNTATGRGTPEEQVALAADRGYAGLTWGIWRTDEVARACATRGMRLASVTVTLAVGATPDEKEAQLAVALDALAPGGEVWLTLESPGRAPSDPAGDPDAQATLARVTALAAPRGVRVVLYPHFGSWMERFADALRLAEATGRDDVGVCFNLCHWLRLEGAARPPAPALAAAGARLFAVTLSGADAEGTDWRTLIRPLDVGDYDVGTLLAALRDASFTGTFALQGFGLEEPPAEHLTRSIAAWWRLAGGAR